MENKKGSKSVEIGSENENYVSYFLKAMHRQKVFTEPRRQGSLSSQLRQTSSIFNSPWPSCSPY
jgi:hypothetical protein